MTITPEEWDRLNNENRGSDSFLMGAAERQEFLMQHAPELYLKAQKRTIRAYQRRSNKQPVASLEFEESTNFYDGSYRALEDLVLECVDAGIEVLLYL